MTETQTLTKIRANLLARIDEITSQPKPNYSIDGQSVSWQSYLDSLFAKLKAIDDQIVSSEPFEVVTRSRTEGC